MVWQLEICFDNVVTGKEFGGVVSIGSDKDVEIGMSTVIIV